MRDIVDAMDRWRTEGKQIALATVLQTWGSSPRRAGSKMAVATDGQFAGSVSGGCVENAVMEAALETIKTSRPQLLHFGVADETAWGVGLACGGSIDVFVQPLSKEFFPHLRAAWVEELHAVHATVIHGSEHVLGREVLIREDEVVFGNIGDHRQKKILELAKEVFVNGESQRVRLDEEMELFMEFIAPAPTLIVVGGAHIAVALMSIAKTLGYRTLLIDPRAIWSNEERFPNVDQLIRLWPDAAFQQVNITSSTATVMLTHDPKVDDPALKIVLNSSAFYVGALGSKTTNAKRRERLLNEGITETQLSRLHAPIGLDIGAETPEEIALAIMSEVVNAYRKREQLSSELEADFHSTNN